MKTSESFKKHLKENPHHYEALDDWMDSNMHPIIRNIDEGSVPIGNDWKPHYYKSHKNLIAALEHAPIHEGTGYRGLRYLDHETYKGLTTVGTIAHVRALSSASKDEKTARKFAATGMDKYIKEPVHNSLLLKIRGKFKDITPFNHLEREILLTKGQKHKITHVDTSTSPHIVHMEETL